MNFIRTTILLAALTALFLAIGHALGGQNGMILAFFIAIVMNFSAYWFSDKIVLATYKAQEVSEQNAPELFHIVRTLTQKANLPMPRVYIVNDDSPNAFATGRNPSHAAVAVTTGILRILNAEELMAVLAHELSHVRHRDTLTSAIAATIAGAVGILANMAQWAMLFGGRSEDNQSGEGSSNILGGLVLMILSPIIATLIQLAVSRSREYSADEGGAELSGNPLALASALQKLAAYSKQIPMQTAEQHPATAHLFIVNPLSGETLKHLFSTHPPTEERVRRLQAMAQQYHK